MTALRNQVAAAGRAGQWRRVIELIDATYGYGQDCPPILVPLRAEAKWRLGKRQGAVQDWASLLDPSDETTRAVVLALSGDQEGYAAYAKQLLARPAVDGIPANNRAWAVVLLPHAVKDYTPVIALAKKGGAAARGNGERALYLNTLGAAYLRAENYPKAREVFLESERLQKLSTNWPLLALCYRHLGQTEESQRWAHDLTNHLRRTFGGQGQARYELLLFQEELTLVEKKHL